MQTSDVKLELPEEFKERMDKEILRRVRSSVSSCTQRDNILRGYALQVDGLSTPWNQGPWVNSCQLDDPLTIEHVMGQVAWLLSAVNNDMPCMIDSLSPDNEQLASQMEGAFNAKMRQWNFHELLYDLIYNLVVYPFAPCRVGWKRKSAKFRIKDYAPGVDPNDPDAEKEDTVREVTTSDRPDLASPTPQNFYLYPPNAQDLETCEAIIERQYYTVSTLFRGIEEFEFDKEEVMKLIDAGPTGYFVSDSEKEQRDSQDGTEQDAQDGVYECYMVWGQMPIFIEDGEILTPEHLIGEDFIWVVCPGHDMCFKWGPPPYPIRGYDVAHFMRYPGRLMGRCVPQILEALQEEATVLLRGSINIAEFAAQPVMLKPEAMRNDADAREVFPGAEIFFPGMNPDIVKALQWDKTGVELLANRIMDIRTRARDVMGSGEGVTQANEGSSMTATENSNINANSATRRDTFLQTFLASLSRIYKKIWMLWMIHMEDEGEDVMTENGPTHVDRMVEMANEFIFTPNANSSPGNTQQRLQLASMKGQVQQKYFAGVMQLPNQFWPELYHGARKQLQDMGETRVEPWIGKEPMPEDPNTKLMEVAQFAVQAAQQKDPAGQQLLQLLGAQSPLEPGQDQYFGQDQGGQNDQGQQPGVPPSIMPQQPNTQQMPMLAGLNGIK